jgi:hypothetical protein
MNISTMTTARRRKPKTTAGIRCVAVFFLYFALLSTIGVLFRLTGFDDVYSQVELAILTGVGIGFTVLSIVVAIGLFRHRRFARWVAIGASLFIALGRPVIGIAIFMYLIRPELDGRFA